eukprot:15284491-Ditylum_brightwellii.AAC.1
MDSIVGKSLSWILPIVDSSCSGRIFPNLRYLGSWRTLTRTRGNPVGWASSWKREPPVLLSSRISTQLQGFWNC